MTAPTDQPGSDTLGAAPTVDEALAALTTGGTRVRASRAVVSTDKADGVNGNGASASSAEPAATALGEPGGSAAPVDGDGAAVPESLAVDAAVPAADNGEGAVSSEQLGQYIERLLARAHADADAHLREAERQAAEQAAEVLAAAARAADELITSAQARADGILEAARLQAQLLAERTRELAAELDAGATAMAATSEEAPSA